MDFNKQEGGKLLTSPPCERNMFQMRVRRDVILDVMRQGLSWDVIYIGFQARYSVTPDMFHFKFFNHFGFGLPRTPLQPPKGWMSSEVAGGQSINLGERVSSNHRMYYRHAVVVLVAIAVCWLALKL